jgi:hypothetical protein
MMSIKVQRRRRSFWRKPTDAFGYLITVLWLLRVLLRGRRVA